MVKDLFSDDENFCWMQSSIELHTADSLELLKWACFSLKCSVCTHRAPKDWVYTSQKPVPACVQLSAWCAPPPQVVELLCRPDDATQIEFSKKSKLFKEIWSSHGALIGSEIMEENETEAVPFESNGVTTEEIFSNSSKARVSQPGLGQLLTESSWWDISTLELYYPSSRNNDNAKMSNPL